MLEMDENEIASITVKIAVSTVPARLSHTSFE